MKTAFVLGGGGMLGAYEVGMLRALSEAGITPDVVVGTSVGAINGVFLAADPAGAAAWLADVWESAVLQQAFSGALFGQMARLARSGTHLHPIEPLRRMLEEALPGRDFADLRLPFHCVAASIERASAHWFSTGPIVPAVLASCAVPGLLPPVAVNGEHFFDGGLVDSIPVGKALALGAGTVYVLHVGRIERPLLPPRRPWEVGLVAFEIARRHRFHEEMAALPGDVRVHVLPSGADKRPPDLSQLRYRDNTGVGASIERAYRASVHYLAALVHQLLSAYDRRPRVVMKAALQFDPSLDVMGNRLPNVFISRRRAGERIFTDQIDRLARGLDRKGALVIFPEGGNWTPGRWQRGIRRLEQHGRRDLAARAKSMPNLLPPRPGGTLAAIAACPDADVIFVAHAGLDSLVSVSDIWRSLPMDQVVVAKWWRVPVGEVPRTADHESQVKWLYDWWQRIDEWITANRPEDATAPPLSTGPAADRT